ncbi:MAG TPA: hypothetical protein VF251_11650 [Pyrinomonadaceae bacterium]
MRYLLGTLSEEERDRFEEMYFSDESAFEEVEIAEAELIDRYVRDELSKTDRAQFESVAARSPRLLERVEFARVWKAKLAAPSATPVGPVPKPYDSRDATQSWWASLFGPSSGARASRLAFALSVLLLLVGGGALLAGWLRVRDESRRLEAQQAALEQKQRELDQQAAALKSQAEQLARRPLPSPAPVESPPPTPSPEPTAPAQSVFAITLSTGASRGTGGDSNQVIPVGTKEVVINLNVTDASYSSYQAKVLTADRNTVSESGWLKYKHTGVTFVVPAERLPPGDYIVTLDGRTSSGAIEALADYTLHIRAQK